MTSSASASETTKHGASQRLQHVRESLQPAGRHQERPGGESGLDRPPDHLLPLGEEQSVLALEVLAQLYVAQVAVVGEAGVGGIGDLVQVGHQE